MLQLLVRNIDVLPPRDLAQRELHLHAVARLLTRVVAQGLARRPRGLQIVVQARALLVQALLKLLHQPVELPLDHDLGDLRLHTGDDHRHQAVAEALAAGRLLLPHGALENRAAQRGQILKPEAARCLVAQLRRGAAVDFMGLHMERRVLARELRGILLREGDVYVALLTGANAHDLLFKAGDEHARAEQQRVLLTLAAVEGDAVHKALKVQHHLITHGGALGVLLMQVLLLPAGDGFVAVALGQLRRIHRRAQPLVLPELHLRVQLHQRGEDIPAGADVHDAQIRRGRDLQVRLGDGLDERLRKRVVHGVLIQEILAVGRLELLARGLSGRAALHGIERAAVVIQLLQRALPVLLIHTDRQQYLPVLQRFVLQ